jgi:opacity protein-like surface antigen
MRNFLALTVFVGFLSLPLWAQDNPKAEVFGGYQYLYNGNSTINGQSVPNSSQSFNGWEASVTGYFHRYLGIEGDFGGAYDTVGAASTHVYTYTAGPVVSLNARGRVNPFVHALFGGVRVSASDSAVSISENGFAMLFGGGVDVKATKIVAVRLIQADWLYYHFGSNTIAGVTVPSFSQSNNVRISTGIVFRF